MTDEQFERHALELLGRELGAAGLARFLRLHHSGPEDYTSDRVEWQRDLTVEQIIESVKRRGAKIMLPPYLFYAEAGALAGAAFVIADITRRGCRSVMGRTRKGRS